MAYDGHVPIDAAVRYTSSSLQIEIRKTGGNSWNFERDIP